MRSKPTPVAGESHVSNLRDRLIDSFRDKDYRHAYVTESLSTRISTQIRVLREQRKLTQDELATRAGMKQAAVSRLEDVGYASWNIKTLTRLAEALDVALNVQFVSFGEILEEICQFSRQSLERPSFDEDPVFKNTSASVYVCHAFASRADRNMLFHFFEPTERSSSWCLRGGDFAKTEAELFVSSVSGMITRDSPRWSSSRSELRKGVKDAKKESETTAAK
jgi:HTH-type transcriptional regulator / antitoxin HipB